MRIFDSLIIGLNGLRCRLFKRTYPPESVLLLLPHCLQNHHCKELVKNDIRECRSCGRCRMKELKELVERTGIQCCVVSGGRVAQQRAHAEDVQVILAVACRRELAEGIRATFPRRVFSVPNTWPNGACRDTDVDMKKVRQTLDALLNHDGQVE